MMNLPPETAAEASRHELLADIAEQIAQRLIEQHGELFASAAALLESEDERAAFLRACEDAAIDVGNSLADFVAQHWGGQTFYIPTDRAFKLNSRDWEIFHRFERGNSIELAREFHLSRVRIHQIYRRCLEEYRARTQGGLFETPEPAAEGD